MGTERLGSWRLDFLAGSGLDWTGLTQPDLSRVFVPSIAGLGRPWAVQGECGCGGKTFKRLEEYYFD